MKDTSPALYKMKDQKRLTKKIDEKGIMLKNTFLHILGVGIKMEEACVGLRYLIY